MVSTRARSAIVDASPIEPAAKRVKRSRPTEPTTSSNTKRSDAGEGERKARTIVPKKTLPRWKSQEEPETVEALAERQAFVGKRYSPGDGQLDYALTEPIPYRDPTTLEYVFPDFPAFKPNLSPQEILQKGAFDGGYFRPVKSMKSGRELHEDWSDLPLDAWIDGRDPSMYLTRPEGDFRDSVNRWKAFVGQPYSEWEKNGWIVEEHDARGWFQWYCRFWRGRRCEDDERQVGRWVRVAGEESGRWRRILLEKYRKQGVHFVEPLEETVSPGIRQTLHHWAFDPTTDALNRFREEKGELVADEDADKLEDEDEAGRSDSE
ncbi:uncharacterized protein JCM15063_003083 [Sporobolomyces koalae]|uniref:uncharacterized protein n=1 Tax=Sporobolomyces koalae TaxID=500713 RepID=UPI00316FF155